MPLTQHCHSGARISFALALAFVVTACGDKPPQSAGKASGDAAAVQSEEKGAPFSVQVNTAPLFESQQDWSAGYSKATGHGLGVVVGPGGENPNVFAQRFSAKPGEQFRVVARASSVDQPKSMGRIQINWTDASGKFLSVSSSAFEVVAEERKFEHTVTAPAGAASGTIYVAPDGAHVVRYTEMRLLGGEGRVKAK